MQGCTAHWWSLCVLLLVNAAKMAAADGMPSLGLLVPALDPANASVCADTRLKQWLSSLVVTVPGINTSKDGFEIEIEHGQCTQLKIGDITTSQRRGLIHVIAQGVAGSCKMQWKMTSKVMPKWVVSHGVVSATMNNSMLGGSFGLDADMGEPKLPSGLNAECQAAIKLTDLQFSGSNSSDSLQGLEPMIKSYVHDSIGKIICKQLHAAVSPALRAASTSVRNFLISKPTTPSTPAAALPKLPLGTSDLVNVAQNPGMVVARQLLDRVLGNPASSHSLSKMFKEFLGPNGSLVLNSSERIPPLRKNISFPDMATMNMTIDNFTLHGLDTSVIKLSSLSPERIAVGLGFRRLGVAANVALEVAPTGNSPLSGGALAERFDLSTAFQDIYTGASLLLALNQTHLGSLSANQLFSWGCVAPAVHTAFELQASLALPSVKASLTPLSGGSLETGMDGMLNAVLANILGEFSSAFDAVGGHAVATTLRDRINTQIQQSLDAHPICPAPTPTYTNHVLFVIFFSAAMGMCIAAALSIPVSIISCLLQYSKKRWSNSVTSSTSTSGDSEGGSIPESEGYGQLGLSTARPDSCDSRSELLAMASEEAEEDSTVTDIDTSPWMTWDCLAFHPRLPFAMRFGLPVLDLAIICLFIASNCRLGSSVRVDIIANGQPIVQLPSIYDVSLLSSIKDMLEHQVYLLAGLIIVWSGCWPYLKLLMMQFCWFVPTSMVSSTKRLSLLEFLDNWGKWSLVDVFVMVIFMVAFEFDLASDHHAASLISRIFKEAGASGRFSVYVEAKFGFHLFVGATLGSLAVGHVMTAMHRYALQLGEYSLAAVDGKRQRLCNVLKPDSFWSGVCFVWGPIVAMGVSLALVVVGIWVDSFGFTFEGMSGYVLGDKRARSYSVITLGLAIPGSTPEPAESGIVFLTMVYFLSTALVVLAYYSILIVLWCAPLSPRLQTHYFVAAQVLSGFSALEVFVVAILVGSLEIQRFALAIVGGKCDPINAVLSNLPIAKDIPGPTTCFDVNSHLKAGFWILLASAAISTLMGRIMIARCKKALLSSEDVRNDLCSDARDFCSDGDASEEL